MATFRFKLYHRPTGNQTYSLYIMATVGSKPTKKKTGLQLKKIAEKAEISETLSMHISRHSFAYIAQKSGAQSSAIKNILGHNNLSTTERYMGSFDTSKTDETLQSLFSKPEEKNHVSKEAQIIEMLKELSPEQIASIMNSINNIYNQIV